MALKLREAKKKMTKILLVEDDGQIAAYLGELLRAEGFDTQIAGSKKWLFYLCRNKKRIRDSGDLSDCIR